MGRLWEVEVRDGGCRVVSGYIFIYLFLIILCVLLNILNQSIQY